MLILRTWECNVFHNLHLYRDLPVTDVDNDTDIDTVTIIVNAAPDNGDDDGGGGGGGGCFIETTRPESISNPDFLINFIIKETIALLKRHRN